MFYIPVDVISILNMIVKYVRLGGSRASEMTAGPEHLHEDPEALVH